MKLHFESCSFPIPPFNFNFLLSILTYYFYNVIKLIPNYSQMINDYFSLLSLCVLYFRIFAVGTALGMHATQVATSL